MAIDLLTGEHYCAGLYFGKGCDECKKKYPHIKPLSEEERKQFFEASIKALEGVIEAAEAGEPITTREAEKINAVIHPDRREEDGSIPTVEHQGVFMTARQFYNLIVGQLTKSGKR